MRTRYPVSRVIALILGVWNAFLIYQAYQLVWNPQSAVISVGWLTEETPHKNTLFFTLALALGATALGAGFSWLKPWLGYFLVGAGYVLALVGIFGVAPILGVIDPGDLPYMIGELIMLGIPAVWFLRIGLRERKEPAVK